MVVFMQNGRLKGSWVRDSLNYWPSKNSAKEDYHSNFNAELFEKCFFYLCITLLIDFGSCRIHMDGAGYHKRNLHPQPTNAWVKEKIQIWLEEREIYYEANYTKKQLLALAETQRQSPLYTAVEIARTCRHEVIYTPPYHPELQPIELAWAMVKNWIAKNPALSMEELGQKIGHRLNSFTSKIFVDFFRHVQRQETVYRDTQQEEEK
jgi:transposase